MCLQWIVPATQKETAAGANADQSYQSWPWPWRQEIFPNVEKISGRGRGLCKVLQRDRLACAKCSKKRQGLANIFLQLRALSVEVSRRIAQ